MESMDLIAMTQSYLRVTAERQLDASQAFVAEDVEFIFPTGTYRSMADVFAAGEQRYRWIRKEHETWDVVDKGDGTFVVVSAGTLFGENLRGFQFKGVRYVDRITFQGDRIIRQEVWNDLASSGVLDLEPAGHAGQDRTARQQEAQ